MLIDQDYHVGDAVLYQTPGIIPKMQQQPQTGLYTVIQVYMRLLISRILHHISNE
jgi:hypothetical protein